MRVNGQVLTAPQTRAQRIYRPCPFRWVQVWGEVTCASWGRLLGSCGHGRESICLNSSHGPCEPASRGPKLGSRLSLRKGSQPAAPTLPSALVPSLCFCKSANLNALVMGQSVGLSPRRWRLPCPCSLIGRPGSVRPEIGGSVGGPCVPAHLRPGSLRPAARGDLGSVSLRRE